LTHAYSGAPNLSGDFTNIVEDGSLLPAGLAAPGVRLRRFVPDSPLEGDGFELLVPRHESPRFPKHPGRIVAPPV
jgi:hypothetical protein